MSQILKNKNIEIEIDFPKENYNSSRFDWTGKIVSVKYKNICISGVENLNNQNDTLSGKSFYNEFGIKEAIGYAETKVGDWFHKIGVGLLKKEGEIYLFDKKHEIQPAHFDIITKTNKIIINCKSHNVNGFSYILNKEIKVVESSFIIKYILKNTGEKTINTDEYCHNFITINKEFISRDYILKFPFYIKPKLFEETVNLEEKVKIDQKEISFKGIPNEQFFFSNLSGNEKVNASWELINTKHKIGIREIGSFKTSKVNLWGWKHVICPELFFDITVEPGQEIEWSRSYTLFEIK